MSKQSKIILFGTFAGRSFGYLREFTIVFLFGFSTLANDVIFLLTSFDALASVFAYGTITMISIRYVEGNSAYFVNLRKFFYLLGFLYALICSFLIYLNASRFNWGMLIPIVALMNIDYSMAIAKQQVKMDFTWSAFTSVIINSILIICILVFPNKFLFLAILVFGLFLRNYLVRKYNEKRLTVTNVVKELCFDEKRNLFFTVFGTGLFYLIPVLDRFVASMYGQIAIFNYGDRILIFAAVLVNGAFFYPTIVTHNNETDTLNIRSVLWERRVFLFFCFLASLMPYLVNIIFDFDFPQNGASDFLEFSVVHLVHFLPFLVLLTIIQIWTIQSKYIEILKLAFFLIFVRIPLVYISTDVIQYTFLLFILDLTALFYLIRYEK